MPAEVLTLDALSDLLTRVEKAEGSLADDDLGRIICAALGKPFHSTEISCGDDGSDDLTVYHAVDDYVWRSYRHRAPDVSLDAALALVERVLPGWAHVLSWWPPSESETGFTRCTLGGPGYITDETTSDTFEVTLDGDKPKHALALLAALLKALISQREASDA